MPQLEETRKLVPKTSPSSSDLLAIFDVTEVGNNTIKKSTIGQAVEGGLTQAVIESKITTPFQLPSFTVAQTASYTGGSYTSAVAFISDEVGGPTLAFYDGTDWRRVQDLVVISAA